jgi:hypothetical protein
MTMNVIFSNAVLNKSQPITCQAIGKLASWHTDVLKKYNHVVSQGMPVLYSLFFILLFCNAGSTADIMDTVVDLCQNGSTIFLSHNNQVTRRSSLTGRYTMPTDKSYQWFRGAYYPHFRVQHSSWSWHNIPKDLDLYQHQSVYLKSCNQVPY